MTQIKPHEKPVVFLTYFYPPCTLTGANRLYGWVPHLREYGIYPIVVTRHWQESVYTEIELLKPSGKSVEVKYHDWGEEHFVPFNPTLRDRLFVQKNNQVKLYRQLLTMLHLSLGNFFIRWNEMGFLEKEIHRIVEAYGNIKGLVISGNPFSQFHLGYRLNQKYGIPWIADYRDDWTTNQLNVRKSLIERLLRRLNSHFEKKWLTSACCFVTVSDVYRKRLESFLRKKGYIIINGFTGSPRENSLKWQSSTSFTLLYSGTLYPSQDIESLLPCICEALSPFPDLNWKIHFQGIAYSSEQSERVKEAMPRHYHNHLILSPRKPLSAAIPEIHHAQVLLMPVYGKNTGIPSSKIFDYLAARRPVIVYPGDADIIDQFAAQWPGFKICRNLTEVKEWLVRWVKLYLEGLEPDVVDAGIAQKFSRKANSKVLSEILNDHFK